MQMHFSQLTRACNFQLSAALHLWTQVLWLKGIETAVRKQIRCFCRNVLWLNQISTHLSPHYLISWGFKKAKTCNCLCPDSWTPCSPRRLKWNLCFCFDIWKMLNCSTQCIFKIWLIQSTSTSIIKQKGFKCNLGPLIEAEA